ncbi:hypothetical protein B0H16DRAFT_1463286 [Mycena metata]|uniref:Uncharacterized protein n=1 Tax=Mycena metata TaxID=1033252 RepID=A0AAD7ILU4_9AGAR|nr:hypothetical protein B0H16DRAFT_1463286 [Mycena metata]
MSHFLSNLNGILLFASVKKIGRDYFANRNTSVLDSDPCPYDQSGEDLKVPNSELLPSIQSPNLQVETVQDGFRDINAIAQALILGRQSVSGAEIVTHTAAPSRARPHPPLSRVDKFYPWHLHEIFAFYGANVGAGNPSSGESASLRPISCRAGVRVSIKIPTRSMQGAGYIACKGRHKRSHISATQSWAVPTFTISAIMTDITVQVWLTHMVYGLSFSERNSGYGQFFSAYCFFPVFLVHSIRPIYCSAIWRTRSTLGSTRLNVLSWVTICHPGVEIQRVQDQDQILEYKKVCMHRPTQSFIWLTYDGAVLFAG